MLVSIPKPSLTSFTISSIHFRSAAVRATIRSTAGLRNSIAPVSIYPSSIVKTSLSLSKTKRKHTFTSRSISFCCVTMELVLPHSQPAVSLSMSSCCNGRYGWKNASCRGNVRHMRVAVPHICAYLAKQVERKSHVGQHALRIRSLERVWSRKRCLAQCQWWRA